MAPPANLPYTKGRVPLKVDVGPDVEALYCTLSITLPHHNTRQHIDTQALCRNLTSRVTGHDLFTTRLFHQSPTRGYDPYHP